ncbi:hypothetical protein NM208_g10754 [Fusarium decemcellulare]|uniref:Uncharacterized protein n=1 Tax=Fusarium decemcellulare TaxID=57161 RepID=A0ACC1RWR4_9HYPO|nr:hypothetical protein NM208_g10754 [Fusarium decemcellulare]
MVLTPAPTMFSEPVAIAPEFISTFYIDDAWIDAVVDGALSVGNAMGGMPVADLQIALHQVRQEDMILCFFDPGLDLTEKTVEVTISRPPHQQCFGVTKLAAGQVTLTFDVNSFRKTQAEGTSPHHRRQDVGEGQALDHSYCRRANHGLDDRDLLFPSTVAKASKAVAKEILKDEFQELSNELESLYLAGHLQDQPSSLVIPLSIPPARSSTTRQLLPDQIGDGTHGPATAKPKGSAATHTDPEGHSYLVKTLYALSFPGRNIPARSGPLIDLIFKIGVPLGDCAIHLLVKNPVRYKHGVEFKVPDPTKKTKKIDLPLFRLPIFRRIVELTGKDLPVHTDKKKKIVKHNQGQGKIHAPLIFNGGHDDDGLGYHGQTSRATIERAISHIESEYTFKYVADDIEETPKRGGKRLSTLSSSSMPRLSHTKNKSTPGAKRVCSYFKYAKVHACNSILYCLIWLRLTKAGVARGAPNILVDDEPRIWLTDSTVWPLDLKVKNDKKDKKDWSKSAPLFKVVHGQDALIGVDLFTQIPVCDKKPGKLWWADKKHNAQTVVEGYIKKRQVQRRWELVMAARPSKFIISAGQSHGDNKRKEEADAKVRDLSQKVKNVLRLQRAALARYMRYIWIEVSPVLDYRKSSKGIDRGLSYLPLHASAEARFDGRALPYSRAELKRLREKLALPSSTKKVVIKKPKVLLQGGDGGRVEEEPPKNSATKEKAGVLETSEQPETDWNERPVRILKQLKLSVTETGGKNRIVITLYEDPVSLLEDQPSDIELNFNPNAGISSLTASKFVPKELRLVQRKKQRSAQKKLPVTTGEDQPVLTPIDGLVASEKLLEPVKDDLPGKFFAVVDKKTAGWDFLAWAGPICFDQRAQVGADASPDIISLVRTTRRSKCCRLAGRHLILRIHLFDVDLGIWMTALGSDVKFQLAQSSDKFLSRNGFWYLPTQDYISVLRLCGTLHLDSEGSLKDLGAMIKKYLPGLTSQLSLTDLKVVVKRSTAPVTECGNTYIDTASEMTLWTEFDIGSPMSLGLYFSLLSDRMVITVLSNGVTRSSLKEWMAKQFEEFGEALLSQRISSGAYLQSWPKERRQKSRRTHRSSSRGSRRHFFPQTRTHGQQRGDLLGVLVIFKASLPYLIQKGKHAVFKLSLSWNPVLYDFKATFMPAAMDLDDPILDGYMIIQEL